MRLPAPRHDGFPTRLQAVVNRYGSAKIVSELTGQAPKTISDWLRGVRTPHASTLRSFCQKLEISVGWLLHGAADPDDGVVITRNPPAPPKEAEVTSLDQQESITAVSPVWMAWRFGIRPGDQVRILHATSADSIPGEIESDEPVLFRVSKAGYEPRGGEILVISDPVRSFRIWKVPVDGSIPGKVLGTVLWTGRTLNRRT